MIEMLFKSNSIKVIVWDLDGTLFFCPEIALEMKTRLIKIYKETRNVSLKFAKKEFDSLTRKMNWSLAIASLSGLSEKEILSRMEEKINRKKFAGVDKELLNMFQRLKNFRHIILSNATYKNTVAILYELGFTKSNFNEIGPFEKIFTLDRLSAIKPNLGAFKQVLKYTKLSPDKHLMVGDIWEIDILPAKKLKFKTCLIGFHKEADFNIGSVYQVPSLFSIRYRLIKNIKKILMLI